MAQDRCIARVEEIDGKLCLVFPDDFLTRNGFTEWTSVEWVIDEAGQVSFKKVDTEEKSN